MAHKIIRWAGSSDRNILEKSTKTTPGGRAYYFMAGEIKTKAEGTVSRVQLWGIVKESNMVISEKAAFEAL